MVTLDFIDKINEVSESLPDLEHAIGMGLNQPFNNTNSGSRKILSYLQSLQRFPLIEGEKAIIETGYEIRYGDYSSSITRADTDYTVIAKISKFSFAPNHHYWLILKDNNKNKLDIIERISYHHITQSYGYLYNNEYMDSLQQGSVILKDTIIQKSLAFDEYNNRKDGRNFNVAYMALDDNMEDSVIIRDVAAGRLTSPLIKPVQIMINDNDIPLNIYGDEKRYKVFPDIGEDIVNGNLIALRKEKKEEAYYTQSVDRLRKIIMSDEIKQVKGKVIDVDIYCNNSDILDNHYYEQLKMYHNELKRVSSEAVQILLPYASENYEMTYELQKFFANAKRVLNGDLYIEKRPFSNIILNITVLEELRLNPGDKTSNRYGGKGVVSDIWDTKLMPRFKNAKGEYEYIDIIFNSSTMINRENVGQVFEMSLTHIGWEILYRIEKEKLSLDEAYDLIRKYIGICSPKQGEYMDETVSTMTREELAFFIESIISSGAIHLSMKPISESMSIDKLIEIYKMFPWVKQNEIEVSLIGSNGQIRYIKARRPIVVGKQYVFRLEQFAAEKFSATSLSSTNIRNENTKSRVKKDFRELYSNTPIRFGYMEISLMNHIGAETVVGNLMIHSTSPSGRRAVEEMYTGDPFKIDIKLGKDDKSRSAEIANTYLKTIGRRLKFIKKLKVRPKVAISPILFSKDPVQVPVTFVTESQRKGYNYEKDFEEREEIENKKKELDTQSPFEFEGSTRRN